VFGLATLGTLLVAERGRLFGVRPLPLQGPTGSGRTDRL
jgi:hypothetical protein